MLSDKSESEVAFGDYSDRFAQHDEGAGSIRFLPAPVHFMENKGEP